PGQGVPRYRSRTTHSSALVTDPGPAPVGAGARQFAVLVQRAVQIRFSLPRRSYRNRPVRQRGRSPGCRGARPEWQDQRAGWLSGISSWFCTLCDQRQRQVIVPRDLLGDGQRKLVWELPRGEIHRLTVKFSPSNCFHGPFVLNRENGLIESLGNIVKNGGQ